MAEQGMAVELYIYDLTNGLASILSPSILGRQIEGVWHTAVVVYDREFFYGGSGITSCAPGGTQLGPPHRVERLGETFVPFQVFSEYIQGLSTTTYRAASQELGARRSTLAEKLARKERRRDKKRKKQGRGRGDRADDDDAEMAEAVETAAAGVPEDLSRAGPSSDALAAEADERREEELRKRNRDPPIVFTDIDGVQEFEKFSKALETVELTPEERQSVDELQQYLVQGEGSWVLGDDFLAFIGRVLRDASLAAEVRVCCLRCLAAAALREDVSLVLHQDRRHHALLNYAHDVDRHSPPEQYALALFLCNLFENISSSEWLLYISEWEYNGQPLSNIRATTKVTVHSCLSSDTALRDVGTALMYNIATKEVKTVVFDEVCVELAMALLQLLAWAPPEELLWRATRALARFAAHSHDVPQLIAMVGPDPAAFRGTSPRVDEQIDLIMKRVK